MATTDGSGSNPGIAVSPPPVEETNFDREKVVFVKVPASMETTFDTGPTKGTIALADIFTQSRIEVDDVEQFTWPVADGLMYAFRAYDPTVQSTTQARVQSRGADDDPLPEPLQTVYDTLSAELPDALKMRAGTLPIGVFGRKPAVGSRLVMVNDNQKIAGRKKVSGADANALFEDLADEPFLYHVIYRRPEKLPEKYEYQVTVRIFLFDPTYRIRSESEYAQCLRMGRRCDPAESFAELGTSSSLAVIDDAYNVRWLDDDEVTPIRDSGLSWFSSDRDRIRGETEFVGMCRGQYGASDILEDLCSYTSLLAREVDLEHFVGLGTIDPPENPWQDVRGPLDSTSTMSGLTLLSSPPNRPQSPPMNLSRTQNSIKLDLPPMTGLWNTGVRSN
ncbi:hypothetical protein EI982_17565 [Haloplanus rallus]|uniref:Uncharacterized protein n=1 Tax=Haloplanus rallus TaxID=1816183 RepID=A0A6B9F7N8_9EURY|nr:hypothetical protein [Haloplanus rallus]QGX96458.1 hypothetical protein EI982_17565 [Haloplanus rallus]